MAEILVMEDDEVQASLLNDALVEMGHGVTIAYNGVEAWHLLQSKAYDILLTDIYVDPPPNISIGSGGFALIGRIRQTSPRSDIYKTLTRLKIIAITGSLEMSSELDTLRIARRFGADACLRKPISLDELEAMVNDLISND